MFELAKYTLGLIGFLAICMVVVCSLVASGLDVPGLTAMPDSTKLVISDSLDSGLKSISLTTVLILHFVFIIFKVG